MRTNIKRGPSFHVRGKRQTPSIGNLSAALTINGITVYPTLRYKGGDATSTIWTPWGYGETLTLQAGTAPTYNNGSPLLGSVDDSVKFNGVADGYYVAKNNSFGDITTEDFVVELVVKPEISQFILGKGDFGVDDDGWQVYVTTNAVRLVFQPTGGSGQTILTPTISNQTWLHILYFINRDENSTNGANAYCNAIAGNGVNCSGGAASITINEPFNIGDGFYIPTQSSVSYAAMWKQSDWHQAGAAGPAEWAVIAATRFAQLTGTYPIVGTATPTFARSTPAYLDKIEANGTTRLYYVGANWPRVCSRLDGNGATVKGYLGEKGATNSFNYCNDVSNWTLSNASAAATSIVCPDGITRTTSTFHEDGSAATYHRGYTSPISCVSGTRYCLSGYFKAINRDWVVFRSGDGRLLNRFGSFNIGSGIVGTVAGGVGQNPTISIEAIGNDWYRCIITATATSSGDEYLEIYAGEADQDYTFDGLDQDSFAVFGVQVEAGNYPSSAIPTTTAAATRSADSCYYSLSTNDVSNIEGAVYFEFYSPSFTPSSSHYLLGLSNAGSAADMISLFLDTSGFINVSTASTGGSAGSIVGSVSYCDNEKHTCLLTYRKNELRCFIDGAFIGSDTTFDVPKGISRLEVGQDYAAANQSSFSVSNVQIFPTAVGFTIVK